MKTFTQEIKKIFSKYFNSRLKKVVKFIEPVFLFYSFTNISKKALQINVLIVSYKLMTDINIL